jgi:hypothetical protein
MNGAGNVSETTRAYDEFEQELARQRPITSTPGYWQSIADNCVQWVEQVRVSPFWQNVGLNLPHWALEYRNLKGGVLLRSVEPPKFDAKGQERIRTKVRQIACEMTPPDFSVVLPASGAPVPALNDLVRTRVRCQYLDGVDFLAEKLVKLGEAMNIRNKREYKGKLEGYFAQHFYFEENVIFRFGGVSQMTTIQCEVQVATELSTPVWDAGHFVYEAWRGQSDEAKDWQWNPKAPRFLVRQLGHMLHLADGILVQMRDSAMEMKNEGK